MKSIPGRFLYQITFMILVTIGSTAAELDRSIPGQVRWKISEWPADGRIARPEGIGNISAAYIGQGFVRKALIVEFNKDATVVTLHVPKKAPKNPTLFLELAEKTTQHPDGRIVLSALDSRVVGKKAQLETHPGNHRIGFWANANDYMQWDYKASRWGMYDVELTYSTASPSGTEAVIEIGDKKLPVTLKSTGSWYRYTTIPVGRVYLSKAGKHTVNVKCTRKVGGAVMNLKAVTLRPAPEGNPIIVQSEDSIILNSKDSTVHGVMARYEPDPKKLCIGFWANPGDWASWDFEVKKAGTYNVQVHQGCGKDHGGSEVNVHVGGKTLGFTVKDTGHFQNFIPRDLGTVSFKETGRQRLEIRPVKKAGGAVMDIRQILLLPVE